MSQARAEAFIISKGQWQDMLDTALNLRSQIKDWDYPNPDQAVIEMHREAILDHLNQIFVAMSHVSDDLSLSIRNELP